MFVGGFWRCLKVCLKVFRCIKVSKKGRLLVVEWFPCLLLSGARRRLEVSKRN